MTAPRIVFIDFDGTYAARGFVPDAHAEAVAEASRRGHRILLCTGRPKCMLPDEVLEPPFAGVVAGAGGYAEVAGEVLLDLQFPAELGAEAVATLQRLDAGFLLEASDALAAPVGARARLERLLTPHFPAPPGERSGVHAILDPLEERGDLEQFAFTKATVFESPMPAGELAAALGPEVAVVPSSITALGPGAGEFYLREVTKASGMVAVLEHLGLTSRDAIAVGDGHNDLEMLEHAGTAVAVETGPPELLALADLVIAGPESHGLVDAFRTLDLI